MNTDAIIWTLAILAVLITFLNPGGLIIGLLIALVLLGGRYGLPYVGGLIRDRQRGASSAKISQGTRKRFRGGDNE